MLWRRFMHLHSRYWDGRRLLKSVHMEDGVPWTTRGLYQNCQRCGDTSIIILFSGIIFTIYLFNYDILHFNCHKDFLPQDSTSLQWRHFSAMASQITSASKVYSPVCSNLIIATKMSSSQIMNISWPWVFVAADLNVAKLCLMWLVRPAVLHIATRWSVNRGIP